MYTIRETFGEIREKAKEKKKGSERKEDVSVR